MICLWTIYRLETLVCHSRPSANSSSSPSDGSSPNTTMRFTRQLPPVRTTLRVTLEVMLAVGRSSFHTKAHLSQNQCNAFCQSLLLIVTDKAPNKAQIATVALSE